MTHRLLPALIAGLILCLATVCAPSIGRAADQPLDCSALSGIKVAKGAIGLPTGGAVVKSAVWTDDPANGRFCKLSGAISPAGDAPDINFQLNLPAVWNRKALQIGGGGYDGALVNAEAARFPDPAKPSPLKQGYATFGSDSGHVTP